MSRPFKIKGDITHTYNKFGFFSPGCGGVSSGISRRGVVVTDKRKFLKILIHFHSLFFAKKKITFDLKLPRIFLTERWKSCKTASFPLSFLPKKKSVLMFVSIKKGHTNHQVSLLVNSIWFMEYFGKKNFKLWKNQAFIIILKEMCFQIFFFAIFPFSVIWFHDFFIFFIFKLLWFL